MKPKILHTRSFKTEFMKCLSRYPIVLQIAVPFIGKIPGFQSISCFSLYLMGRDDCKFQLITRPPVSSGRSDVISMEEAKAISKIGVDLIVKNNTLHSKVYQFTFSEGDRAAFVGSANFTLGGFERNVETMAYFQGKEDNDKVAKEIERIARPAYDFTQWLTLASLHQNNKP